jgi:hypothetical protein
LEISRKSANSRQCDQRISFCYTVDHVTGAESDPKSDLQDREANLTTYLGGALGILELCRRKGKKTKKMVDCNKKI